MKETTPTNIEKLKLGNSRFISHPITDDNLYDWQEILKHIDSFIEKSPQLEKTGDRAIFHFYGDFEKALNSKGAFIGREVTGLPYVEEPFSLTDFDGSWILQKKIFLKLASGSPAPEEFVKEYESFRAWGKSENYDLEQQWRLVFHFEDQRICLYIQLFLNEQALFL